ncbi:hypothetical protein [Bradyrhizobium cajani]|uniref:Oligosaccharide repeat unit polymerase n=1 Tax=Bradyrhizobium cajani TaxID=1928661 RepID=A0A844TA86_9BRAD|nr:hypothetical protein [Bradyrhizobium cajani]MCP3370974.1 hypothetical protein [Bradyrhizobium cajani]MVT71560.1 hypothetical protein [Bradyrhizobium cajani]
MTLKDRWQAIAGLAEAPGGIGILICLYIVTVCFSLIAVTTFSTYYFSAASFHIFYDPARWPAATAVVAAFALVGMIFLVARFSFGYLAGFYLYSMILGYLWLNCFSDFNYDHRLAAWSAAFSAAAFLVPATLMVSPVGRIYELPARLLEHLLTLILLLSLATIIAGAIYNFRIVAIEDIYSYRDKLNFPAALRYAIGMVTTTLLPFAFACFVVRGNIWRAVAALVLSLLFYPVTLTKFAIFTPVWLVFIAFLARYFGSRTSVILSLLLPMLAGLLTSIFVVLPTLFYTINFRMMIVPSNAFDIYNDYFSRHELTYFCQIGFLKPFVPCAYNEPLSIVMNRVYELGFLNASLFATEGVASVGPLFAPIAAFACGLVIALGNRLSADLPPNFVMISSAILPQVLLNTPLSTTLLTHGAGLLFLLWYVTPRELFEPPSAP